MGHYSIQTNACNNGLSRCKPRLYDGETRRPKRSGDGSNQRVRRSSRMRNRLMGMRILIIVALASSAVAFAQNGQRGTQRGNAGTASSKPFNPHDLSGFWDI